MLHFSHLENEEKNSLQLAVLLEGFVEEIHVECSPLQGPAATLQHFLPVSVASQGRTEDLSGDWRGGVGERSRTLDPLLRLQTEGAMV